jgi:hypothetical protein
LIFSKKKKVKTTFSSWAVQTCWAAFGLGALVWGPMV